MTSSTTHSHDQQRPRATFDAGHAHGGGGDDLIEEGAGAGAVVSRLAKQNGE